MLSRGWTVAIFFCLAVAPSVRGRLGEDLRQLAKRFGQPYRSRNTASNTVDYTFHVRKGNFDVQVLVREGISVAETYYSTQPLQPNGEPPGEIVRGIFQTNVPRARWLDQPANGEHKDAAFVTADGRYQAWISNNGAWYSAGCTFVVGVHNAEIGVNGPSDQATQPLMLAPSPSPSPEPLDPAVRAKLAADLHAEVTQLLAKATGESWAKNHPDSLEKIPLLTPDLAGRVTRAEDDAREFRKKIGYEESLRDFKDDMAVVDALAAFAEATTQIHSGNAIRASEAVDTFHQTYPAIPGAESKALWEAVDAIRLLLDRFRENSKPHLEKAKSLSEAGKTGNAVQEYQKAYEIFPDPSITERIKALREESLGL